ncbi:hypothetical protein QVD17_20471 [Tagetes erecta]|uniref:Uncharacterized protein n=1 Tax=Tagetes erecta TaxID=13708 RepID=A0AAD8KPZ8_TARER|nr:hypothetical protein QVD17_20469 [Tagetes erecta]KAK1425126.1 hypothetical protein QVD17_20471 [Tagetes erecta]
MGVGMMFGGQMAVIKVKSFLLLAFTRFLRFNHSLHAQATSELDSPKSQFCYLKFNGSTNATFCYFIFKFLSRSERSS